MKVKEGMMIEKCMRHVYFFGLVNIMLSHETAGRGGRGDLNLRVNLSQMRTRPKLNKTEPLSELRNKWDICMHNIYKYLKIINPPLCLCWSC